MAEVVQSADPNAATGTWESSRVVDASAVFGEGAFLVDVQAHSLFVDTADGPDFVNPPPGPDWLYKREGGQLLLLRIPGRLRLHLPLAYTHLVRASPDSPALTLAPETLSRSPSTWVRTISSIGRSSTSRSDMRTRMSSTMRPLRRRFDLDGWKRWRANERW